MSADADLACPKCEGRLESRTVEEDITVLQCGNCRGLFVPPGTTKKLLAVWGPDTNLDTGSEILGKKFDRVDDIECPQCNVKMDRIEDLDQPHIWTENCGVCGSTFYDAGELTDLKDKTISDFFKKFLKGKR